MMVMGANSQIYEMRVENRKERIKDERVTTLSLKMCFR